jgi:hypothetical protein
MAALVVLGQSRPASAQVFEGDVNGVELITQDLGGQAVFLFRFAGSINEKSGKAIGIIGLNHEALPSGSEESEIESGSGKIYVGFRSYKISDVRGTITVNESGPYFFFFPLQFNVEADFLIGSVKHQFTGILRHDTLPFSLEGSIGPPDATP